MADGQPGPRAFIGDGPWPFRESVLPANTTTALRATQFGLEAWAAVDPAVRSTQAGLEVWTSSTIADPGIQKQARLGPVGLLGVPPRKFREGAGSFGGFSSFVGPNITTGQQCTQAGLEVWCTQNPTERCTQAGLEVWCKIASAFTPPPFLWVVV